MHPAMPCASVCAMTLVPLPASKVTAPAPVSTVNDRIVIEKNGMVLKLPAQTAASRIAEIVLALEARR